MRVDASDVTIQLRRMSSQRWSLAFTALVAATLVPIVTGIAGSGQSPVVLALVVGLAGAAVTQPDSHVGLGVPFVAVWHWTASTGASTDGWALVVALCLFAFHTIVALMSTTPPRATIDRTSMVRWLRRGLTVALATGAVWALVQLVEQQGFAGSAIVTAAGFVVASALMVVIITYRRSGSERAA